MDKENKKKLGWKRTFQNNGYMIGLIMKASPGLFWISLLHIVLSAIQSFLFRTYLFKYALNALQEGKPIKTVVITISLIAAFGIVCFVFYRILWRYYEKRFPVVDAYFQNLLQKKAAEVDLACYEDPAFYDDYVKAINAATDKAYATMNNVLDFVWVVVYVVGAGALVAVIDPIFLLFALLPLIYTLLIGRRRNRIQHEYDMRNKEVGRQKDYVRRTFYLRDYSKEMRLTEMWKVMYKRMHSSVSEMKNIVRQYGFKLMLFRYAFDLIYDLLVSTGTIVLAAYKTLVRKTMLLGDCFVVINSISSIAGNVEYVGEVFVNLHENALYVENLRTFLDYEVKIAEDETAPAVPRFAELELKNVSFTYAGQTAPALSDVNLTVRAGERIAVVGHNGAGKTTLVKLLQRLYDPSEGEILLNGEDIRTYRLSSYRDLYGIVFQDYRLFAATVAENVLLRGNVTDEDREKVKDALKRAGVYEKVESLPEGVDSTVTKEFDKDGAVFSGGEAQKISIARLFAGDQEIVIMDEPTSALDPIAEQEMYRNMFDACEGKTVIFISHRLSSATMADRIYMFENGAIIEEGKHAELLRKNGKYAEMWHKQADSYSIGEEASA